MKTTKKVKRYELIDHICKICAGRIAVQVSPSVVTGGGWPVYFCTSCEAECSGSGPDVLCWCGEQYASRIKKYEYLCYRIPDISNALPEEVNAFTNTMNLGINILLAHSRIGIVTWDDFYKITQAKVKRKAES